MYCDQPVPEARRVYCSYLCDEEADYVRFLRKHGLKKVKRDPDLHAAQMSKLLWILRGGHKTFHNVRAKTAKLVKQRDGQCVDCGQPGKDIHHKEFLVPELHNRPENLEWLCKDCHRPKGFFTDEQIQSLLDEEASVLTQLRLHHCARAKTPISPCDDVDGWNENRVNLETRQLVENQLGSEIATTMSDEQRATFRKLWTAGTKRRKA